MIKKRLLTGFIIVYCVINSILYLPPLIFEILVFSMIIAIFVEYFYMKKKFNFFEKLKIFAFLFLFKLILILLNLNIGLLIWTNIFLWLFLLYVILFAFNKKYFIKYNYQFYIFILILISMYIFINVLKNDLSINNYYLLNIFIIVCLIDSSAYLIGKLSFKNKVYLSKNISPNKTWNGIMGIFFIIFIFLFNFELIFFKNYCFLKKIVFLFFIIFLAIIGDLAESLFKRNLNIKNSGYFLPGHGGLLDRMDSLIPIFPFFLLFDRIFF